MTNETKPSAGAVAAAQEIIRRHPLSTIQATPDELAEIIDRLAVQPVRDKLKASLNERAAGLLRELALNKERDQWREISGQLHAAIAESHDFIQDMDLEGTIRKNDEAIAAYEKLRKEIK